MPVARPAQDFSEDPGWTNLTEPDRRDDVHEAISQQTTVTGNASASPACRLRVQLADNKVHQLEFTSDDDLPRRIKRFVEENNVKDIFEGPLLAHAESMSRCGKLEDSVDIVDLL